jgi:tetratricopeptide (TPR) repeat protein
MASKASSGTALAGIATAESLAWLWFFPAALAAVAIFFSPAVQGPFVFDDYLLPFANPRAARMPVSFWIGGVRPVLIATYWANFLIAGTQPLSYHLVNLILHAIAGTLVFFILRRLLAISGARVNPYASALFGAGVFLLHPLQTESVDYIAGRSELVCAVFFFSAWLVFLKRFESKTSLATAAAILLCGAFAVLGKENAVSLPAVLLATDLYWRKYSIAEQIGKRLALYVPCLAGALTAAVLILGRLAHSNSAGFSSGATPFQYALTQCRVILTYIRLFFVPVGQSADWGIALYRSFADGAAWIYALGIATLVGGIFWLYRRARMVSFGLLVFLLLLAPTSSFVPIHDAMAERRMYMPIAGLVLALLGTVGGLQLRLNTRVPAALATAVLVVLAGLSFRRSEVWASDFRLWQDVIAKDPGNARAHMGLAGAMMLKGECAGAAREYRIVFDQEGMNEINARNLAEAYRCNRQFDEALTILRALVAVKPVAEAYNRIGYIEAVRGNANESLAAFESALRADPNNATAYAYRGTARLALKDPAHAREDFQRALALDPDNAVAAVGMANLQRQPSKER